MLLFRPQVKKTGIVVLGPVLVFCCHHAQRRAATYVRGRRVVSGQPCSAEFNIQHEKAGSRAPFRTSLGWLGTVRGRVGVTVNNVLFCVQQRHRELVMHHPADFDGVRRFSRHYRGQ